MVSPLYRETWSDAKRMLYLDSLHWGVDAMLSVFQVWIKKPIWVTFIPCVSNQPLEYESILSLREVDRKGSFDWSIYFGYWMLKHPDRDVEVSGWTDRTVNLVWVHAPEDTPFNAVKSTLLHELLHLFNLDAGIS